MNMLRRCWLPFLLAAAASFANDWATALSAAEKNAESGAEPQPATIKFSAAPSAVQKTFRDEAAGAKIETLTQQSADGASFFLAYAPIDGKKLRD